METRQERLTELRRIEMTAIQEQHRLRDEERRDAAARIRAGECYFRCESSFRDDAFSLGNWTNDDARISVYVKVLEVIERTGDCNNFELLGVQFWTTSDGRIRIQTGRINWTIDAFEMAFAGDYPEKPITEAEFSAAWNLVEIKLQSQLKASPLSLPSRGEH